MHFIGSVTQDKLALYYQSAAVFVAPFIEAKSGDQEGLGLVLVEAIACGCPIVVSDIPACNDVIEKITNVKIFPARNEVLLIEAICQSLKIKEPLSLCEKVNSSIAIQRFNWPEIANNYSEKLNELLNKN